MQLHTRGTLLDDSNFASMLHHLAQYHTEDGVLSVYLEIEPAMESAGECEKALKALLEPLHTHTKDTWLQGRLEYEIAGVIDTVRSWRQPPGPAVAMFFCGPGGLAAVIPLRFHIRPFARFARRPVLSPLISAVDEHRRYCVVMFERRHARIVSVMLGEVEEEITIESDLDRGITRWSDQLQPGSLHVRESELHAHAMRTVEHLWTIDRSRPIHALILAGDPGALTMLRRLLPRALSRSIVETSPIDSNAITPDIAYRVRSMEAATRETEDRTLVLQLIDARKDDMTAAGWEPTLAALNDGRVQLLVLADEGAREGVYCPQDHFVMLGAGATCPVCEGELTTTQHLGEAAIRSALVHDGQVRILTPELSREFRSLGAGALLRF